MTHVRRSDPFLRALIVLTAALLPAVSDAQVPTMPMKVCASPSQTALDATFLDELTTTYNQGDWTALQTKAQAAITAARTALAPGCPEDQANTKAMIAALLDTHANYIGVSWVGTDPLTDKTVFMRVVVHDPSTAAFGIDLPGIAVESTDPKLAELFVSRSAGAESVSRFTSTQEENPLVAQLPAFVQAIAGPLFGTIGATASQVASGMRAARQAQAQREPLFATVSRVVLPFRRASIKFSATARDAVDQQAFLQTVRNLPAALKFKESAYSTCARLYADDLSTRIVSTIEPPPPPPNPPRPNPCSVTTPDPAACMKDIDTAMVAAYQSAIGGTLAGCTPAKADVDAMQDVDQKFRTLVKTGSSTSADAELTFHNRPLTRWSLGAGSAVMGYAKLDRPRVDVDKSGNVVADPLTRVMTLAFLNWSPTGYDETAPVMQSRERFRLFVGAALTPDFGVVGGVNVMLVRGLGLCVGAGALFAKGADPGEIGKPPAEPTDPYRLATARVAFAGITYNYK